MGLSSGAVGAKGQDSSRWTATLTPTPRGASMPLLFQPSLLPTPLKTWKSLHSLKGKIREAKCVGVCLSSQPAGGISRGHEFKASFSYVMNLKPTWAL